MIFALIHAKSLYESWNAFVFTQIRLFPQIVHIEEVIIDPLWLIVIAYSAGWCVVTIFTVPVVGIVIINRILVIIRTSPLFILKWCWIWFNWRMIPNVKAKTLPLHYFKNSLKKQISMLISNLQRHNYSLHWVVDSWVDFSSSSCNHNCIRCSLTNSNSNS